MRLTAREENAKTLASVLGLDEEVASSLLDSTIVITASADREAQVVCRYVVAMLSRTVARVSRTPVPETIVEVVVGDVLPRTNARLARVGVTSTQIVVSSVEEPEHDGNASVPAIILLIAACYAAATAVRVAVGDHFTLAFHDTIRLPVARLLRGYDGKGVDIGQVHLAGAGAIGNGFLWALSTMDVRGEVQIVDPKRVSEGNLGRCHFFSEDDLGQPKAERLAARAQTVLPGVRLVPRVSTVQDLPERSSGAWLKRLAVAVDSRRARRRLQDELPGDVFDASTTGIEEVVFHFNTASGTGVCLSCVYHEDAAESAREKHVAETLGVTLEDVKQHYVNSSAAVRIAHRYPSLQPEALVGKAYDTLFKTMCATGQLTADDGRTVLAPFSFVSVLAGSVLALELVHRVAAAGEVDGPFNFWRLSPWTSPVFEVQTMRARRENCEACANPHVRATVRRLWGTDGKEPT